MNPLLSAFSEASRALADRLSTPAQERLVLLVNHVLSREPLAADKLRAHAGKRLRVDVSGLPALVPALPSLTLAVTRAGLFEREEAAGDAPDLALRVVAPQPPQWLSTLGGEHKPAVQIEGDAALAGDMQWLVDHLRWDIEADLAQWMGPIAARQVTQAARGIAAALRGLGPMAPPR